MLSGKNNPKVTVLLAVYNRPSVSNTIDSILRQTFNDFELLVIDNDSTDNTRDVVNAYDDKRIVLVKNEKNMGQTYSLNRGLNLARGEYIARIDADDLMQETRLEKQVEFLDKNPDYGFCGTFVSNINMKNGISIPRKLCSTDKGLRLFQGINSCIYHPSVMYRKRVLITNNILYNQDYKMAEDYDMWRKLLSVSKGYNVPEVLTYYRVGDNDSVKHADITKKEYFEIREKVCESDVLYKYSLKSIQIEKKNKKSIIDCIRINYYLNKYLNNNMSNDDIDYKTIKSCIRSRVYKACAKDNEAFYAYLIKKLFGIYSKIVLEK